jgi:hypothetical protein
MNYRYLQSFNIISRLPLFCFFIFSTSLLRAESVDQQKVLDTIQQQTGSSVRLNQFYARNVILSILPSFDDSWALKRIDSESKDGNFYLRFHFQTIAEEILIIRAQVEPSTGKLLKLVDIRPEMREEIAHAPSDEIGNVAALKLYILSLQQPHKQKQYSFRDFDIVRINKSSLVHPRPDIDYPEQLIILRSRILFPTNMRGQGSTTFVYDASIGKVITKSIGDMLTRQWISPPLNDEDSHSGTDN